MRGFPDQPQQHPHPHLQRVRRRLFSAVKNRCFRKDPQTDAARRWSDHVHGIASWYGGVFNGRRTASGEVYDMYAMTACHPTLPFGSIVRVIDQRNHDRLW